MDTELPVHPTLKTACDVDVIGDVHGCYQPLKQLLQRLGYRQRDGVWGHSERLAIFVGDIIDRGPDIRRALDLVWRMCDAGNAVMVLGNHEYNAIRYAEPIEQLIGGDIEAELPERISRLMKETIIQFMDRPREWARYCRWMSELPLFMQGPGYRVVHACWDADLIDWYRQRYPIEGVNEAFLFASYDQSSTEHRVVDRLTRGTSMPLPKGMHLEGKDGFIRRFFRTKFWADSPETYGDVVFQPDPLPYEVAENRIQDHHHQRLLQYGEHEPPVFFGHYWMKGRPSPLQQNIACLDYSAVNFGRLAAYTYRGEASLNRDHFTWVYVDP